MTETTTTRPSDSQQDLDLRDDSEFDSMMVNVSDSDYQRRIHRMWSQPGGDQDDPSLGHSKSSHSNHDLHYCSSSCQLTPHPIDTSNRCAATAIDDSALGRNMTLTLSKGVRGLVNDVVSKSHFNRDGGSEPACQSHFRFFRNNHKRRAISADVGRHAKRLDQGDLTKRGRNTTYTVGKENCPTPTVD